MSHFSTVKTKLTNRECLIQALQDLELQPQVHKTPQPLTGYYGGSQGQSAEIIVSGHTFKALADIGFRWNSKSGVYDIIHDAYETNPQLGQNFFTHNLVKAYGRRMVLSKAAQLTEQFGECTITQTSNGQVQTLRLTFAAHQQTQQYVRR
ncbi:MAG: DUF1257 domain-containing protein [Pelatocladus maniniholoensis HA4357-MV3]|jgi:hypothetical protein|uniref:DUF1257 domain-containing protein n=1 Tax=Pelatocladus maniniholoensis HA4357-MV3 TaxID=1117104 RepID=A0A9E3LS08_9NOST|nr:DUF1257 domain-containing protein [Pelatocladus maniniholoensis HA4357-MV3]